MITSASRRSEARWRLSMRPAFITASRVRDCGNDGRRHTRSTALDRMPAASRWPRRNSLATFSRLYDLPYNVEAQAMSTPTEQAGGRDAKPAPRETQPDLYDPHFPTRQRAREAPDRARTETFDPHFPSPKRH